MRWPTPEAPSALPLEGATPVDRQSRLHGAHLLELVLCVVGAVGD